MFLSSSYASRPAASSSSTWRQSMQTKWMEPSTLKAARLRKASPRKAVNSRYYVASATKLNLTGAPHAIILTPKHGCGGTLAMTPAQITRAVGAALKAPLGLFGWIIVLSKPVFHLVDRVSEMDFIASSWQAIRVFLETGYGTLISIVVGTSIIGYSIVHAIHTASSSPDITSYQPHEPQNVPVDTTPPQSRSVKLEPEVSVRL